MKKIILVAASINGVIGKDNTLPWRLPEDMKRFKKLTLGHTVIMGRKTYESIGKPLPERCNIVLSHDPNYQALGCLVCPSIESALELCENDPVVFFIGGEAIYRMAMPLADTIYLTRVLTVCDGDAFLPPLDLSAWQETERLDHDQDEKHAHPFSFLTYERKNRQ